MMVEKSKLTDKQLLVIPYILNSFSIEEACQKAGMCRGTYYLWLKDDNFKSFLDEKRKGMIKEALDALKTAVKKAVSVLIKLTSSKNENIRRFAAKDILDYALKSIELDVVPKLTKEEKEGLDRKWKELKEIGKITKIKRTEEGKKKVLDLNKFHLYWEGLIDIEKILRILADSKGMLLTNKKTEESEDPDEW